MAEMGKRITEYIETERMLKEVRATRVKADNDIRSLRSHLYKLGGSILADLTGPALFLVDGVYYTLTKNETGVRDDIGVVTDILVRKVTPIELERNDEG